MKTSVICKTATVPEDNFHQAENVDLLKKLVLIQHQRWLSIYRSLMDMAQFLIVNQITGVKCLKNMIEPLSLGPYQTLYL